MLYLKVDAAATIGLQEVIQVVQEHAKENWGKVLPLPHPMAYVKEVRGLVAKFYTQLDIFVHIMYYF